MAFVGHRGVNILGVGREACAQIEVVKKSVFLVSDVYESSVKTRHQLVNLCEIEVTHRVSDVSALFLQ